MALKRSDLFIATGIFAVILFGGFFIFAQSLSTAPDIQAQLIAGDACPDSKTGNLDVRMTNAVETGSANYIVGVIDLVDDTGAHVSTTTLTNNDGTRDSLSVPCPSKGVGWVSSSTTVAGATFTYALAGSSQKLDVVSANASSLNFCVRDTSTGDNITTSADCFGDGLTTTAQTFNSGTVKEYEIQAKPASAGQFGPIGLKPTGQVDANQICVDFNTGKFKLADGVIMANLGGAQLTRVLTINPRASVDNMDKCWEFPTISSNDVLRKFLIQLNANLGDPGSSDDVTVKAYDFGVYVANNGLPTTGYADDSVVDIGASNPSVIFDIE